MIIISVCSITVLWTVIASKPEKQALSWLKIALYVILSPAHYLMSSSFRPEGRTKLNGFSIPLALKPRGFLYSAKHKVNFYALIRKTPCCKNCGKGVLTYLYISMLLCCNYNILKAKILTKLVERNIFYLHVLTNFDKYVRIILRR